MFRNTCRRFTCCRFYCVLHFRVYHTHLYTRHKRNRNFLPITVRPFFHRAMVKCRKCRNNHLLFNRDTNKFIKLPRTNNLFVQRKYKQFKRC